MLASHAPGEKIPWSALEPALRPRDLSVSRTAEILDLAGLLDDDRVRPIDTWIDGKLAALAPGIAGCARSWVTALRHGTARSLPRSEDTVRVYLRGVHPALEQWSRRYDHLREVTAADVTAAIAGLRGHKRHQVLTALRSLTRHCKKNGLIFADPAARIRGPERPETIILPLPASRISAVTASAAAPAARLALALAAVHALRPEAIRHLALGDIDLRNRRIALAGQSRPLDDLTRRLITEWLTRRRERWPQTTSPYLLINNQTAMTTRPVSENWLAGLLRGLGATLEQLRVDRQLDEALTAGPTPSTSPPSSASATKPRSSTPPPHATSSPAPPKKTRPGNREPRDRQPPSAARPLEFPLRNLQSG